MKNLKQCIVNDYTKNMNFAWRFLYKVKNYVRKNLYRQSGDFKESEEGQFKFCWPEKLHPDNTEKLFKELQAKTYELFEVKDNREVEKNTKEAAKECVKKGCNFQKVGDWICDAECNNAECHWDEGDCDLPDDRKVVREFDKVKDKAFVIDTSASADSPNHNNVLEDTKMLTSNVLRYCGDKKCSKFTAFVCKAPFCNPKDKGWDDGKSAYDEKTSWGESCKNAPFAERIDKVVNPDNGEEEEVKRRWFPYRGFFQTISEKDYCPDDCTGNADATDDLFNSWNRAHSPSVITADQAIDHLTTTEISWKSTVTNEEKWILSWNGSLSDGTKSNSVKRRYGIRYKAPKGIVLSRNESGQTFLKFECDGTFGWGVGNGFHFVVRIPGIYKMFNLFSQLFKYSQSCRYEINKLGDITQNIFRANWQLWNPLNGALLRLTQSIDGKRPSLKFVENDKKYHRPYGFLPYPSETNLGQIKLPGSVCTPDNGRTCVSGDKPRIVMPKTCSYEVFEKYEMCRLKFTGLTELLGTKSEVLFEMNRCSAESGFADSLFTGAVVMTGDVATTFSPLRWCKDDNSCKKSQKCVDFGGLTNLDQEAQPQNIKSTTSLSGDGKFYKLDHQTLRDPFAAAVYGMKGANEQCIQKDKPIQNSIRNLIRKMGYLAADEESDLKVCLPSWAVDFREVTNRGESFLKNRMEIRNNGLVIRGLESTGVSALFYGLDKYMPGNKNTIVNADAGYEYQTIKIDIDGGSKDTTCEVKDSIKRGVITHLKNKIPEELDYLTEKDVLVNCEDAQRRRMLLSSKVKVAVSIQLDEKKKAELAKKVNAAVSDDAGKAEVAKSMGDSGVILADGKKVTSTSINAIDAPEKTAKSVKLPTDDLDPSISNGMKEKANKDEASKSLAKLARDTPVEEDKKESTEKKKEDSIPLTTVLIYVGIGLVSLCVCACGVGFGLYYMGKAHAEREKATPNPLYEMRPSDLSKMKTTQNQMRVSI